MRSTGTPAVFMHPAAEAGDIRILRREFSGRQVARSTLYRHLHREGATRRKLGIVKQKVRRRWTRDQSNALWVGDFSEGPKVFHHGQAVKSHLSIWIDCHSRYVIEGRYYFRENLDILLDSLLRAWGSHGASRELYVDNAKVYHSGALKLAAAELNIHLRHRPPRDPPPGGLVERVIQTVQDQFERDSLREIFGFCCNTLAGHYIASLI